MASISSYRLDFLCDRMVPAIHKLGSTGTEQLQAILLAARARDVANAIAELNAEWDDFNDLLKERWTPEEREAAGL